MFSLARRGAVSRSISPFGAEARGVGRPPAMKINGACVWGGRGLSLTEHTCSPPAPRTGTTRTIPGGDLWRPWMPTVYIVPQTAKAETQNWPYENICTSNHRLKYWWKYNHSGSFELLSLNVPHILFSSHLFVYSSWENKITFVLIETKDHSLFSHSPSLT